VTEPLATVSAAPGTDLENDLGLYRRMLLIRRFEEAVQRLFLGNEIYGTTHLYNGQEASAVGVASMLKEGDRVAATYRGHGAALAMGTDPQALMDELCGRSTGVCAGRAGSMNVVDLEHEVHDLPVIFVCENNLYMEFTPIEEVTAGPILARPQALELPARSVDGNDVWAVRAAAGEAIEHARSGKGPAFMEVLTYRFVGHSRSDPGAYRKPGELEKWQKRDPLVLARERLAEHVDEDEFERIEEEVNAQVDQVTDRALEAPWPNPDEPVPEFKS
jgi:TPP-dependent pyruvate/acetoin dehydrogenase alpha subunit